MRLRAGIVITGTEVLSGRVRDRNGPWLADRLFDAGVELAHVTICGDRPHDIAAQLEFMRDQGVQLVVTSGGLGPTADDKTVEMVAEFAGRELLLDEELEQRIEAIIGPLARRWKNTDPEAFRASTRKQALVPESARVLGPAGTAPGLVVPPGEEQMPVVVVLPGPPRELHELWRQAVSTDVMRELFASGRSYRRRTLRLFGIPESEIAKTLRLASDSVPDYEALEITTCLRRGEIEMVVGYEPEAEPALEQVVELISQRHEPTLFSTDGSSVDEQVADLLAGRTIACAESCTGGLMAARLTERAGSSAYVAGSVVSYSDRAKSDLLGVDHGLLERFGAVSPQVCDAMASSALERFAADTAVAITGVAGPGGGTESKPVGYVCFCAKLADGSTLQRDLHLPGDRAEVRDRSTTIGMHLLRCALTGRPFAL